MKKITFTLLALLALCFTVKAQEYVSTEPANRNVLLEEFTGRTCPYCPEGHVVSNQIIANHPGRVFSVAYHAVSSLSPTSYPNLNTSISATIDAGFNCTSLPSAVINRSTATVLGRNQWASQTNTQLAQAAECNVGGSVIINPATRAATITVEVYYTGNSTEGENYLSIAMTQDSILGSQSGSSSNPSQMLNGQYVHMHVFRDMITPTWGDAISPTTQGTLITKTYEYTIPASIGNPNPVDVDLDNIHFIAWVSERFQGTPTRPVLNSNKLEVAQGSNEPIFPMVNAMNVMEGYTCTQEKVVEVTLGNIGTETLTSMVINATLDGETQTIQWEGSLPQFGNATLEIPVFVSIGNHTMEVAITEANGQPTEATASCPVDCLDWIDLEVTEETERLKLMLVQDKWGMQTTWEFTGSNGEVIASGGPYNTLAGSATTLPHAELVTVPANECVTFTIRDSGRNGICCTDGNGYYKIFDSNNQLIVDGDGAFGSEAVHRISVRNANAVQLVTETPQVLDYHEVVFVGNVMGECQGLGFEYRKEADQVVQSVPAVQNGNTFTATVTNLELNTDYLVKAYALVNGVKLYGEEVHFRTWVESVSELGQTLKVYPNPADRKLFVEGTMTSVEVYNTIGQCLLSQTVQDHAEIDLASFNNGMYFLRVSNNGETVVRKFSVNR